MHGKSSVTLAGGQPMGLCSARKQSLAPVVHRVCVTNYETASAGTLKDVKQESFNLSTVPIPTSPRASQDAMFAFAPTMHQPAKALERCLAAALHTRVLLSHAATVMCGLVWSWTSNLTSSCF
jgi:hypothetical protein